MGTDDRKQAWARGGMFGAAALLFLVGVFHFFTGLSAVIDDQNYFVGPNYTYAIDTTAWGWIHMIGGVVLVLTALALLSGRTWARVVAIAVVTLSAIANFFFIPYQPIWSLLMIAIDVFAIWAIANARSPREREAEMMMGSQAGVGYGAGGYGGAYTAEQAGQRWPENVPGREEPAGRHYASEDMKERGRQYADQEQARRAAAEAEQRARESGRGYRG
jgi:hypothetical protein